MHSQFASIALALFALQSAGPPVSVTRADPPASTIVKLPLRIGGRVAQGSSSGSYLRQWPGTYFETALEGESALFRIGPGDAAVHLLVDGRQIETLVKPAPGYFRIDGLAPGKHRLRIEFASESQAGPTEFGGFYAETGVRGTAVPAHERQIEFIGDSHTVGYANTSSKTECSEDEVWATTDSSRGFGPLLAKRYDADYRINAISGRGIVRNYNGFKATTLPEAYRATWFDSDASPVAQHWSPQLIVIALGTNDFTTALHDGEKWTSRAALHADYERTYVAFMRQLRAANPKAYFIVWATDMAGGEIETEALKVVEALRAGGERRITFMPFDKLKFGACHAHPSLADDALIATRLARIVDSQPRIWNR